MQINILPDKKLFTKHIYTVLTISLAVIIFCVILQILIPLDPKLTYSDVALILWPICAAVILLSIIISLPLLNLWVKNLSYIIETDRVIIKKGIISKIEQNIPFTAITDFMLHRSLYDRILGIASIRIQTAGQSINTPGYEGTLAGLVDYNNLYSKLQDRLKNKNANIDEEQNILTNLSGPDLLTKILMELTTIREILEDHKK